MPQVIRAAEAMALARPSQWFTITRLPRRSASPWAPIHRAMDKIKRSLRRWLPTGEWCYQVEPNADPALAHAHCWWRGPEVDGEHLERASRSAGVGWQPEALGAAYVPYQDLARPALTYAFKTILEDRPENPTHLWPRAETYLELNDDKTSHQTYGWWLDRHGQPTTKEVAMRDAHGTRDWWLA